MTIKDITQAAAGTFMSRSCASSKFTLINGSQIDDFQEENIILQIDTTHTYTTNIVPKEERGLLWKRERLYEVYMVECPAGKRRGRRRRQRRHGKRGRRTQWQQ